ncbi:MAG: hypothetical protein PHV34_00115 [Verrucomicrobiae bacterium]|nr:hypothetical protein [Verrucomicrobiae bacterium]
MKTKISSSRRPSRLATACLAAICACSLVGCTATEQGSGIGAAGGALIGGLAGGWKWAAVGAGAGALLGAAGGAIKDNADKKDSK